MKEFGFALYVPKERSGVEAREQEKKPWGLRRGQKKIGVVLKPEKNRKEERAGVFAGGTQRKGLG